MPANVRRANAERGEAIRGTTRPPTVMTPAPGIEQFAQQGGPALRQGVPAASRCSQLPAHHVVPALSSPRHSRRQYGTGHTRPRLPTNRIGNVTERNRESIARPFASVDDVSYARRSGHGQLLTEASTALSRPC